MFGSKYITISTISMRDPSLKKTFLNYKKVEEMTIVFKKFFLLFLIPLGTLVIANHIEKSP